MDDLLLDANSLKIPVAHAPHLAEKYQQLLTSLADKSPESIYDSAKVLVESVMRTVITDRNGSVDEQPTRPASIYSLCEQTIATFGAHDTDAEFVPILKSCTLAIATMRNNYGAGSHGQDGYVERTIDLEEALFIARLAMTVVGYIYTRHTSPGADRQNARLHYEDYEDFNAYIDREGDIEVAGILVAPSRILFDNDPIAYKEQLLEYENDTQTGVLSPELVGVEI